MHTPDGVGGGLLSPGFDKSHWGERGMVLSGLTRSAFTQVTSNEFIRRSLIMPPINRYKRTD